MSTNSASDLTDSRKNILYKIISLGGFAYAVSMLMTMAIVPSIAADLGLDAAVWGINMFSLGVLIGSPILALSCIKMDYKKLLIIAISIAIFANVLFLVVPTATVFIVSRFILGIPLGVYFAASGFLATRIMGEEKKGSAMALPVIGFALGPIFGTPTVSMLVNVIDWKLTYLIVTILFAICLALIIVFSPNAIPDPKKITVKNELLAFKSVPFILVNLLAVLMSIGFYAFYSKISSILADMDVAPTAITVSLIIAGIFMYFGASFGGKISNTNIRTPYYVTSFGLLILFVLGLPLYNNWIAVVVITALSAALVQCLIPAIQVSLVNAAPKSSLITICLSQASLCMGAFFGNQFGTMAAEKLGNASLAGLVVGIVFAILSIIFSFIYLQITKKSK
ncbi:MAG: MFS transporter [Bifidobacteriaceae bacterium]|jgi:DHA1 family inner membrane transport protein|nr:MFS transporter [Bifidobacteriaceae bacterium]